MIKTLGPGPWIPRSNVNSVQLGGSGLCEHNYNDNNNTTGKYISDLCMCTYRPNRQLSSKLLYKENEMEALLNITSLNNCIALSMD